MERKLRILSFVALGFMVVFIGFMFATTFVFEQNAVGWTLLGITIGTGATGISLFFVIRGLKKKVEKQKILEMQAQAEEAFEGEDGEKKEQKPIQPQRAKTQKEIDNEIYDLKDLD